jgi:hypothetical protein
MAKKVIFQISGGIGKCIAATALVKGIKEQYPDHELIVVSGYPDVFVGNPNIGKTYSFAQLSYFYQDHIEGHDIVTICQDPYLETSHIRQEKHLIETWYELAKIDYNGQKPELFLSDREIQFHQQKIQAQGKPLMFIQSNGGADNQAQKYSWARDIPTSVMLKLIEHYSPKYDIVHIRRQDQIGYNNTSVLTDEFRGVASMLLASSKRVFMDSFAQHTAMALNLPSTVLWIANKPEVFGYDLHTNVIANPETKKGDLKTSFLGKYDISGNALQFPYNSEEEIFDIDKIIAAIGE